MTTEATPREVGSHAGLGLEPEREAFERWLNPGGFSGNVSPWVEPGRYQKETHQLAWLAWRGAVAAERERWQKWACRKEWDNVNDPPCHPSDKGWRPCDACEGPNGPGELPASGGSARTGG